MSELGLGDLRRRYTRDVLDDIDLHPHNAGAKEVRELVRLALWNLADVEGLWVCGAGHVIRINPGTPPYEMGLCPICDALEERERLENAARRAYEFLVREGYEVGVIDELRTALTFHGATP